MLKNKKFNIVFAIVIAISLWAYVLGDVNPTTKIVVKDVPITFVNQDLLEASGKTVLSTDETMVNITISGQRTEVTRVEQNDFQVTADVEALDIGQNVVRLNITGLSDVDIADVSLDKVTVTVDELVSVEKDIHITTINEIDENKEPYVVEMDMEKVNVSGAKSLVNTVKHVDAVIDESKLDGKQRTLTAELKAVNFDEEVVDAVTLQSDKMNLVAILHTKKTVSLKVPFANTEDDVYEKDLDVPKTIEIKGADDILETVTEITCEEIDLSQYTENTEIDIVPILPEGIQVTSKSSNLHVKLTVKPLKITTVKIPKGNIKLINASSELSYSILDDDISIEVRWKESEIAGVDESVFTVSADVKDLGKGAHDVALKVESEKKFTSVKLSKEKVQIIIK